MVKISRFFLLAMLVCFMLLTGCKSKQVTPYTPTGNNRPEGSLNDGFREGQITEEMRPGQDGFGPATEGLDATGGGAGTGSLFSNADSQSDAYKREHGRSSPAMKPVYFDFDQSIIRADQIPSMEHNGAYLNSNPSRNVVIEGNTDYRGTNEYNMALGERRAASAKSDLMELGVAESRIRTISYGEERPLFLGENENDYSYNRRADFILE